VPVDTVLHNSKVFYQGKLVEAGIAIDDGKIVKIAKEPNLPSASEKINLNRNIIFPGLIDVHVHLRDQKLAYKETFETGTAAAAAGGITTVIDMPNNNPITMSVNSINRRMKLAQNNILVNVGFNSALPGKLEEISEIIKEGAMGFKVYFSNMIGGINIDDDTSLIDAFKKVALGGVPVLVHAEDKTTIDQKRVKLQRDQKSSLTDYLAAHSPKAESHSIERIISLVKKSKVRVHFCHISSSLGINLIISAKKLGLPVTCEVTPHNLLLSSEQYITHGKLALTDPPLRTKKDLLDLWKGLKSGEVDVISSDHAPHILHEKLTESIWKSKPGIPGLETTLSLLLDKINENRLSFSELVKLMVENPARIFHLKERGLIEVGNWADLVVLDMKYEHKIDSSIFYSKAKHSPFEGMRLKGKAVKTFVNGKMIMNEGVIVKSLNHDDEFGKILKS